MAAPQSAPNPITASLTVIGAGALLSVLVGVAVGLATGDMARSVGVVVTWGMVLTAVAGAAAALVVSARSEATDAETD